MLKLFGYGWRLLLSQRKREVRRYISSKRHTGKCHHRLIGINTLSHSFPMASRIVIQIAKRKKEKARLATKKGVRRVQKLGVRIRSCQVKQCAVHNTCLKTKMRQVKKKKKNFKEAEGGYRITPLNRSANPFICIAPDSEKRMFYTTKFGPNQPASGDDQSLFCEGRKKKKSVKIFSFGKVKLPPGLGGYGKTYSVGAREVL